MAKNESTKKTAARAAGSRKARAAKSSGRAKSSAGAKVLKRRIRRNTKVFYGVYFAVLFACLIVIAVVCVRLTPYLADYEKSNPRYAADEVMSHFTQADWPMYQTYAESLSLDGESPEAYLSWLGEYMSGGEFSYQPDHSSDDNLRKYAVRMNGQVFGAFYLRRVPDSTEYGFETWTFDHLDAPIPEAQTYQILAPTEATVMVGTQQMTAANAVEAGIPTVWNGYMLTEDIAAPTLTRYSVERRFSQPEVTAWDQYGACAVHKDENEVYVVERNYDARLQAEATERVEKVVNTFSKFVADDTSRENMLDYVRKGTNAYSIIQTFDNNWFGRHSGAVVTNLEIGDFIRFSEDTMACRIHYDFVVSSGDNSATYDTNYWFYFVYRNDQWYLYDFYAIL